MTVHQLKDKPPSGYRVVARGSDRAEIYLYGVIGEDFFGSGVTADQFQKDLKQLGNVKTIDLRINSEGGDVFHAQSMYTLLVEHPAKVVAHVDGLAASAASFLAMAGNEIHIAEGAFMMIHNASKFTRGGVDEHRRAIDLLVAVNETIANIYVARTRRKYDDIKKMMDAETWMTGREAIDNGFADKLVANLKVAASVRDPANYKHLPAALRPRRAVAQVLRDEAAALIRR